MSYVKRAALTVLACTVYFGFFALLILTWSR